MPKHRFVYLCADYSSKFVRKKPSQIRITVSRKQFSISRYPRRTSRSGRSEPVHERRLKNLKPLLNHKVRCVDKFHFNRSRKNTSFDGSSVFYPDKNTFVSDLRCKKFASLSRRFFFFSSSELNAKRLFRHKVWRRKILGAFGDRFARDTGPNDSA